MRVSIAWNQGNPIQKIVSGRPSPQQQQQQRQHQPDGFPSLGSTSAVYGSFFSGFGSVSSQQPQPLFTQVISDVDDTLKSSGGVQVAGVALGGIDVQYNRGEIYPGVAEFMLALSSHPPESVPAKIAILTARAEEFKAALEIKDESKLAVALRSAGTAAGIDGWGIGPVLYGSVAEWIIQDRKGLRKFTNFERLIQQDPTGTIFQYIYVGDVGELDQEAGETMLREYPEVVKAVFLHVVSDREGETPIIPALQFINGRPLVFFRTYVGAAVDAVQLGFMDMDGLQAVIDASIKKLANVPQTSDKWLDVQKDINRAKLLLSNRRR
ncbi:hypothetical protein IV203_013964 [Nitzschia inconspicua]|uniref:Uncharacterized protein n=1 Tax=Nitzschia inconspicua TaxID=303405 RepID=A0A9K3M658_9STRA|nr:hypothetical protein IV203_013964 [Nitzschia inconspicua]